MHNDTLNTISSWVYELLNKKKIDTEVSGVTCSLVLEACAGLVAVVPKPDNNVIAGVLSNILIIVGTEITWDGDKRFIVNGHSCCINIFD